MHKLIETQAHLGYRTVNSHYQPYLHGFRNQIAIIDLDVTLRYLRRACFFIESIIRRKGSLLFVNTNPEYNNLVKYIALSTCQRFQNNKWIGGFLTNSNHIQQTESSQPDCIIVLNASQNSTAIEEAYSLGIPIIAIVDSNVSKNIHKKITYPIPANADSLRFVYILCNCFFKIVQQS